MSHARLWRLVIFTSAFSENQQLTTYRSRLKKTSVLRSPHPGRGLSFICFTALTRASAASFGEAATTRASVTSPSSLTTMATVPLTDLLFHFLWSSSDILGLKTIFGGCLQSFFLLCALAGLPPENRMRTSPTRITTTSCRELFTFISQLPHTLKNSSAPAALGSNPSKPPAAPPLAMHAAPQPRRFHHIFLPHTAA